MSATFEDLRRSGIGASEAAAAIGVSPWASQLQLWAEKTGQVPRDDLSEVERVQWGHLLQPIIASEYAKRRGVPIRQNRADTPRRHPRYPFVFATVDAIQPRSNGRDTGTLEIKTTAAWNAAEWDEGAPLHYQVQLQHQLAVTGHSWGTLCCLVGGQQMRWVDFDRDETFIAALLENERLFWEHVESGVPPRPDGSPASVETIKRLYPTDAGETIALPPEADEWDRRLSEAKGRKKEAEDEIREMETKIKAEMREAAYATLPSGGRYSWKTTERHEKPREARTTTMRTFRRLKK